ncbi:MAG: Gx transporter family protein [Clostridia bacterium]|nr:Gx transporter family protein [Clostridia bacterium]
MDVKNVKHLVFLAVLVAQAMVLSVIESWLPVPQVIPGVKLGLANIITLVVLVFFGFRDALIVVFVRCFLASVFSGGILGFAFSISGGILSTIVMALIYLRFKKSFSLLGISIAGAVAHNIGQLGAASFVMKELAVMSYLPILLISGIIMGCFVGLCSGLLVQSLKKTNYFKLENRG